MFLSMIKSQYSKTVCVFKPYLILRELGRSEVQENIIKKICHDFKKT